MLQDRVKVLVGDNDFQWEVRFSREVHRETGVSVFLVPAVTVQVDPTSGEVALWETSPTGSIEEHAEQTLFSTCRSDIETALQSRGAHVVPGLQDLAPAFA